MNIQLVSTRRGDQTGAGTSSRENRRTPKGWDRVRVRLVLTCDACDVVAYGSIPYGQRKSSRCQQDPTQKFKRGGWTVCTFYCFSCRFTTHARVKWACPRLVMSAEQTSRWILVRTCAAALGYWTCVSNIAKCRYGGGSPVARTNYRCAVSVTPYPILVCVIVEAMIHGPANDVGFSRSGGVIAGDCLSGHLGMLAAIL